MDTHPDWKLSVGMDHLSSFLALEGGSVWEIGRKVFGLAVWICYGHPSRLEALGRYGSSLRLPDWKHPGPSTPTSRPLSIHRKDIGFPIGSFRDLVSTHIPARPQSEVCNSTREWC
ncbi:hypothetical protein ACLB2K_046390 [Fragaria x ananassa]